MDRNEFLKSMFAPATINKKKLVVDDPFTGTISEYTGSWTDNEAIHLLKRLTFGAPIEEVNYFKTLTYSQAVDTLLNTVNTAANIGQPIKTYTVSSLTTASTDADWSVPLGRSWANTATSSGSVNASRRQTLKAWWLNNIITQPRSIEEKMILFWSTHFAIEFDTVSVATLNYKYVQTLRQYCLGNFKAFTKAITLDPAMLIYLNGYLNTKTAPDENYARELQELFTMGKGPQSLYTEDDVKAAAKVLTGYDVDKSTATSLFKETKHDTNPKQFSAFYSNTIINRPLAEAALEIDDLMNMIFNVNEVSMYICRRLYRFFVYDDITADTELNIITPLAATFKNNNYEIKPVLNQLFKSAHFFDVLQYGATIKSPVDYIAGLVRECKITFPPKSNPILLYKHVGYLTSNILPTLNQDIGDPPNVSGFAAYYQTPLFDRVWVDTDTFTKRQALIAQLISNGYSNGGFKLLIDAVAIAKRMPNPADPNELILDINKYFLRRTLSQTLRDTIKVEILLTGQASDYYWSDAWFEYINNPSDLNNYSVVSTRLKNLISYFISKLEEYHLM
jgi:uncharacterized protein (DUF1800 family)